MKTLVVTTKIELHNNFFYTAMFIFIVMTKIEVCVSCTMSKEFCANDLFQTVSEIWPLRHRTASVCVFRSSPTSAKVRFGGQISLYNGQLMLPVCVRVRARHAMQPDIAVHTKIVLLNNIFNNICFLL